MITNEPISRNSLSQFSVTDSMNVPVVK